MDFLWGYLFGVFVCGICWLFWLLRHDLSKSGWNNFWYTDDRWLRPWARWVRNKLGGQRFKEWQTGSKKEDEDERS